MSDERTTGATDAQIEAAAQTAFARTEWRTWATEADMMRIFRDGAQSWSEALVPPTHRIVAVAELEEIRDAIGCGTALRAWAWNRLDELIGE